MANEIAVTPTNVRPLTGAIVRRAVAAEALAFGDSVYISSYAGDRPVVSRTSGAAVATANSFGVVAAGAGASVAAGEACDVVVLGPVTGYSGMTAGATLWVSNTAGALSSVVGTKSGVVGLAESPTVMMVRPGLFTVSA